MRHTIGQLLEIVYRYHPRGIGGPDPHQFWQDDSHGEHTEEHARLVAARIQASKDERWHAMRRRISERFPDLPLMNRSLHLPAGLYDACYSFTVDLPNAPDRRTLWFHVSFLAPYYVVYSHRMIDLVRPPVGFVVPYGINFSISRSALGPDLVLNPDDERLHSATVTRHELTFDLAPDERPCATWIAHEIESTFGSEPMPPDVGATLVPDVVVGMRGAMLYDCLFTIDRQWVEPSPPESGAVVTLDPSSLTERFIAVLTVLRAHYQIGILLDLPRMIQQMPEPYRQSFGLYWSASTDGFLHKDKMLEELARMRPHDESRKTLRAMAAKRELEALVASWDGEGEPPAAMVAWASSFLANWPVNSVADLRADLT
ncbi:hypothetical protein AB3662_06745 [Sorangium cellulosum]|uniref:hypothetical protein n=1 Tax=Sorangium cellulosum TaxID=56 RepID=UPI003D9AA237